MGKTIRSQCTNRIILKLIWGQVKHSELWNTVIFFFLSFFLLPQKCLSIWELEDYIELFMREITGKVPASLLQVTCNALPYLLQSQTVKPSADRPDLDTLQRCSKFLNSLQLACDNTHRRSYSLTATAFSEPCLRPAVWQIWDETLLTLRENTSPRATNKSWQYITKIIQNVLLKRE